MDSSSYITFAWSNNNGVTWDTVAFLQNQNNSAWSWIQDSVWINLPAAANNQSSIKFCWIGHIHYEASGTYRIDDFTVTGVHSSSGINEVSEIANTPVLFLSNNHQLNIRMKE